MNSPAVYSIGSRIIQSHAAGPWATAMKPLGLAALSLVVANLAGCDGGHETMMRYQDIPAAIRSNGERIYLTGISGSGAPISYTGGNLHLQAMGGGCATGHGVDRGGIRMMPQFWVGASPLTRQALFDAHAGQNSHAEHERYDTQPLRRAISLGIDAAGERMDRIMPRWSMTERDWQNLIAYLRQASLSPSVQSSNAPVP